LDGELTGCATSLSRNFDFGAFRFGSNRNASLGGDELRKFRLGIDAEHAATVKPHATRAITRLMM
jgi:hypothetical protein